MARSRFFSLCALTVLAACAEACAGPSTASGPLRTLDAVQRHHVADPSQSAAVHLDARVSYIDQGWGLYVIADDSSAALADPAQSLSLIHI